MGLIREKGMIRMKLFKVIGFVISVVFRSFLFTRSQMGGTY